MSQGNEQAQAIGQLMNATRGLESIVSFIAPEHDLLLRHVSDQLNEAVRLHTAANEFPSKQKRKRQPPPKTSPFMMSLFIAVWISLGLAVGFAIGLTVH